MQQDTRHVDAESHHIPRPWG